MLREGDDTMCADVVPVVADSQDLASRNLSNWLTIIWITEYNHCHHAHISASVAFLSFHSPSYHSPELIFACVAASNIFAALCTSCPPWLYPPSTTFVSGHF